MSRNEDDLAMLLRCIDRYGYVTLHMYEGLTCLQRQSLALGRQAVVDAAPSAVFDLQRQYFILMMRWCHHSTCNLPQCLPILQPL